MDYLLLAAVGVVSGILNVLAGGGSFLTLPVLIFVGLPPTLANGTNRVGILLQNVQAVAGFERHRVLDWRFAVRAAVPGLAGAGLGTWAALHVGDEAFRRILALLMVVAALGALLNPRRPAAATARPRGGLALGLGFFLVGLYGGFVQAGVGFLVLTLTSLAGLDLVRGNAVKVLFILLLTVLSLSIFAWASQVDWAMGLALGLGAALGAEIGVRLTVLKGHRWVRRVVMVTLVVFAVRLWLG